MLTHDLDRKTKEGSTTLVDGFDEAVTAAQEAAGGKYVNVLGADVARQCVEAGVLDEVMVYIAPVLLGGGVRLFAHEGGTRIRPEPLDRPGTDWSSGLWSRVAR